MAVTVKLRPGLKWADGVPITTADLAFTAKVGRDPTSGFANTRVWNRVREVEVVDKLTAVMHLTDVDALVRPAAADVAGAYRGAGLCGTRRQRRLHARRPPITARRPPPGLHNGPFRITDYDSGQ